MTTVIIRENSPQAKQFVKFARTLPFAEVKREITKPQSAWDKAIAEGAVTPQEFHTLLENEIINNW